jgi:phospholipid/cholesterol/gamma-HCH transport system ATP-binding protein
MTTVPPLLGIEKLVKRFDDHTVLAGVDLTVDRGETVAVVGGSGSGKSTLARLLVGLDEPTSGRILVEGIDVARMPGQLRRRTLARFALVFQKYALLDSMTVYQNVAFPLRERRALREPEIHERVMTRLEALGIADAREKLPGQLSGGMAKRVGIARAMVMDPEILVYDEPTSGLDPVTARLVDAMMDEVRDRFFVTSIVITHDMATALGIADRIVLLDRGVIAVDDSPAKAFASLDPRIRRFAASSGVDPARLVRRPERKSPSDIRDLWKAHSQSATARPDLRLGSSYAAPSRPSRPTTRAGSSGSTTGASGRPTRTSSTTTRTGSTTSVCWGRPPPFRSPVKARARHDPRARAKTTSTTGGS